MRRALSSHQEVVSAEIERRLEVLGRLTHEELAALPVARTDREILNDVEVQFTTHVEHYPDGRLIVLVRSDQARLWGLVRSGSASGFWVLPDGCRAPVTDGDVLDHFG